MIDDGVTIAKDVRDGRRSADGGSAVVVAAADGGCGFAIGSSVGSTGAVCRRLTASLNFCQMRANFPLRCSPLFVAPAIVD